MKKVVVGVIPRLSDRGIPEFLLMSSKRDFGKFTGFYYPPGGHLEENEDIKTALIRKIKEELGFEVIPLKQIEESLGDVKDQLTSWWFCSAVVKEINPQKDEVCDVKWFTKEQIIKSDKVWPATKKFFEKLQIGKAVSAGGIITRIIDGKQKILFVTFPTGDLVLPKGHVENGETLEQTALREMKEETGFSDIAIVKKLGSINRPAMEDNGNIVLKDIHFYLMKTSSFEQHNPEETTDWFTIEEATPHLFQQEALFLLRNIKTKCQVPTVLKMPPVEKRKRHTV